MVPLVKQELLTLPEHWLAQAIATIALKNGTHTVIQVVHVPLIFIW
jgi:hypothetical protein